MAAVRMTASEWRQWRVDTEAKLDEHDEKLREITANLAELARQARALELAESTRLVHRARRVLIRIVSRLRGVVR